MDEIQLLKQEIEELKTRLNRFDLVDKMLLQKHLQLGDGKKIIVGKATGTKIGSTASEKLGFWGVTPVIQAGAISSPTTPSANYVQAEATSAKTAIDAIRTALINAGITA